VQQGRPWEKIGELVCRSGATVPTSGMWRTEHELCSDAPDLWLRRQASFPLCPGCGKGTSFDLLEEILHISEDPDFQSPQS
jgi:hypothetical protein